MAYVQTIKTLIDQGCAVRGVKVRCLEFCNVLRGTVEFIRQDGRAHIKGRDLFGPREWLAQPKDCVVVGV